MITTSQLADALGRLQIAQVVGVGATAVSNAVVRGKFPSSWFLAVRALAEREGCECPPELFMMKPVNGDLHHSSREPAE